MATTFKVGVVPEHFSIPLEEAVKHGLFKKYNINVELEVFPRGTGSMCRALRHNEIDIAVALTEGIISDIANGGSEIQICATYVQSPLHWGVWVHPESSFKTIGDLKGKTFGISRFGSGSHLMVSLLATERGWDIETDVKYEVKGGLSDLTAGISDHSTDAFLWEKFTTKHCEEQKQVRFLGEISAPWPSFVICSRQNYVQNNVEIFKKFLQGVSESCEEFKKSSNNIDLISHTSKLSQEDSAKWLKETTFSEDGSISKKNLQETIDILVKTKILKEKLDESSVYDHHVAKLV